MTSTSVHFEITIVFEKVDECVVFNVPLDTEQVISETRLSRQSTALVLTTTNNQTQHYIHQKHKRETEKRALANRTIYILILYDFYDLRPGNSVGPISTAVQHTQGF